MLWLARLLSLCHVTSLVLGSTPAALEQQVELARLLRFSSCLGSQPNSLSGKERYQVDLLYYACLPKLMSSGVHTPAYL